MYTAVTRGKEEVVVIGPRKYLREALLTDYIRDTGLKGFFQKELEDWQRLKAVSAMEGSTAECNSLPENSGTEMEEDVTVESTPGNVTSNWDMLSSSEVNSGVETHLSEGNNVYTGEEDSANDRDNLPFVSYQSGLVTKEPSQNNRKKDFPSSLESQQPSFLSEEPRFTELRDSQPKQDLYVGELPHRLPPTGRYSPDSEGFNIPEMVASPSKLKFASKNQKEPSVLNFPLPAHSPCQKMLQEGTTLPERPEQEDENVENLSSPLTSTMDVSNQPSQTVMGSSRQSVTCVAQFMKYTQKDSQYPVEEKRDHSPGYSLNYSTPEKNENEFEPESVTSPSKLKFLFKNRRESSILNSPSTSWMQRPFPERKGLPQSPEQEVRYVGTLSTPSKEVARTVMFSPRASPTCSTQFKKRSPKSSQHPMGEDSPDCSSKYLTPEKDETDLGPESKELENLSLRSPMDTCQELQEWNLSGARKRLHYAPAFHQTPTKSPRK